MSGSVIASISSRALSAFVRSITDPGALADTVGYSPDFTFDALVRSGDPAAVAAVMVVVYHYTFHGPGAYDLTGFSVPDAAPVLVVRPPTDSMTEDRAVPDDRPQPEVGILVLHVVIAIARLHIPAAVFDKCFGNKSGYFRFGIV